MKPTPSPVLLIAAAFITSVAVAQVGPGAPASAWLQLADVDGDGLQDAAVLDDRGRVSLHLSLGGGRFEDITLASGLALLEGASCLLLADIDGDGDVDLFAGSAEHRVWLNAGNALFEPVSSGIEHDAFDVDAQAVDLDADGRADLLLRTERGDRLLRNVGGARFERVELPLAASHTVTGSDASLVDAVTLSDNGAGLSVTARRLRRWIAARNATAASGSSSALAVGPTMSGATNVGNLPLAGLPSMICAGTIVDQATSQCIEASSTPTLGELYPLSTNLNVSATGNVGIGTLTPGTKLDVVGSVRATGHVEVAGFRTVPHFVPTNPSSVVGGSNSNSVLNDAMGAAIGGGGWSQEPNLVVGDFGTVAGGVDNEAGNVFPNAPFASVGGGRSNVAWGASSTIAGGTDNVASGAASSVAGGDSNLATGAYSAVGGGSFNAASGAYSIAPGGGSNSASGDYSCALGRGAQSAHTGTFVWADNSASGGSFGSTGANMFLIRASGGMGIGTAAPEAPLHVFESSAGTVAGSASASAIFERNGANYVQILTPNANESGLIFGNPGDAAAGGIYYNSTVANGLSFRCNGNSTKAVLDQNGRLGVGTSAPATLMHIAQAGNPTMRIQDLDAGGPTYHVGIAGSDDSLRISETGVADRVVIERTSGNVGVGTSSPGFLLHVNGTAGKPGGGSWSVASDARLKTNVAELDGALAKLLELHGVTYEYKDPAAIHELEGEQTGFLAQEVERVFPQWVETGADGYKRLSIRGFEALTVEALRELRGEAAERAERDAARIASLEAQMAELKALVQASLALGNAR